MPCEGSEADLEGGDGMAVNMTYGWRHGGGGAQHNDRPRREGCKGTINVHNLLLCPKRITMQKPSICGHVWKQKKYLL